MDLRIVPARHRLLLSGAVLIALVATTVWWLNAADERRVNAACDTWLQHRSSLRNVLTETDEAVGRAEAADASSAAPYFNDLDATRADLATWETQSPHVLDSLDRGSAASPLERGAVSSFGFVREGIDELQRLIDEGRPTDLADWLPEVDARFQMVDDTCLAAARS